MFEYDFFIFPLLEAFWLRLPAPVSRAVLDIISQAVTLQRKMDTDKGDGVTNIDRNHIGSYHFVLP